MRWKLLKIYDIWTCLLVSCSFNYICNYQGSKELLHWTQKMGFNKKWDQSEAWRCRVCTYSIATKIYWICDENLERTHKETEGWYCIQRHIFSFNDTRLTICRLPFPFFLLAGEHSSDAYWQQTISNIVVLVTQCLGSHSWLLTA